MRCYKRGPREVCSNHGIFQYSSCGAIIWEFWDQIINTLLNIALFKVWEEGKHEGLNLINLLNQKLSRMARWWMIQNAWEELSFIKICKHYDMIGHDAIVCTKIPNRSHTHPKNWIQLPSPFLHKSVHLHSAKKLKTSRESPFNNLSIDSRITVNGWIFIELHQLKDHPKFVTILTSWTSWLLNRPQMHEYNELHKNNRIPLSLELQCLHCLTTSTKHIWCWTGLIMVLSSADFEKKSYVLPPSPAHSHQILEWHPPVWMPCCALGGHYIGFNVVVLQH